MPPYTNKTAFFELSVWRESVFEWGDLADVADSNLLGFDVIFGFIAPVIWRLEEFPHKAIGDRLHAGIGTVLSSLIFHGYSRGIYETCFGN